MNNSPRKQAIPAKNPDEFPMRINKYLALKGYATRRGADELIERKTVTINGRPAVLGDKVTEKDVIEVRKNKGSAGAGARGGAFSQEYIYFAANKPRGVPLLDTRKGTKGFINTFVHAMPKEAKSLFPVGSLDPEASGLIIFTNDRRIIDRLENPKHAHVKQYHVETISPLRANFKEKLEAGVSVNGDEPISCRVKLQSPNSCYISIIDPKNRIRGICSLFGAEIANLTRTSISNIQLGKVESGGFRKIEGDELALFLKNLGL